MTAKDHNRLLGIFHLIQGGLQTFSGLFLGIIYLFIGIMMRANAHRPQEEFMGAMFITLALVVAPLVLTFGAINLTAGYKMFKEKAGARTWGIVASFLCLPGLPLGTALGVYGLWFLFGEQGKQFHLNQGNQNYIGELNQVNDFQTPPPPYKWK